ncbi:MAG: hydroxysqualene dehydroxylase [Solirubrobacteraceae bacterium]
MRGHDQPDRVSRREFLRDAGIATAVATETLTPSIAAARSERPRRRRSTAAVFGGGIAGLTAAHELAERGFDVTVYERRAWGGKARSTIVPGSATGGRLPLPGEHAYRAEFGCYQNVPDLMRRIPFGSNPNGVFDNMVGVRQTLVARTTKADLALPLLSLDPRPYTPQQVIDLAVGIALEMELPPDAAAYLGSRIAVFASSCDARRATQWDTTSWRDFIAGDRFGPDYHAVFERLWEFIQGTKGEDTCARYVASVLEVWFLQALLGRGTNGPVLRMLNRPTNEAWIDPWVHELRRLGVRMRLGDSVTRLHMHGSLVRAADIRHGRSVHPVVADHYVCALPVERARKLWGPAILRADPRLGDMNRLGVDPYNGISYFLRERVHIAEGVVICADSPWAGSFVTQAQYWPVDFTKTYGDGSVQDKLSGVVANWELPGVRYGKPASELTPDQVALDLWEQFKQHVNKAGRAPALTDAMLHSWQIDPGMRIVDGHLVSGDPLIMPKVGTGKYRPSPQTRIANLALCGDYLDGVWEVANMEAACFNGRRAANVTLDAAGSRESRVDAIPLYRPPEWEPLKKIDEQRYAQGQPNLFDADLPLPQLTQPLGT